MTTLTQFPINATALGALPAVALPLLSTDLFPVSRGGTQLSKAPISAILGNINTLQSLGCKADNSTDDSTALTNALNSGLPLLHTGGTIYINTAITITGKNIYLQGLSGAAIRRGPSGSITFVNCAVLYWTGVKNIGLLTSTTQYSVLFGNLSPYFAAPTYSDQTGSPVSGSDFTHSLAGSQMTLGLETLPNGGAPIGRNVISSFIPLNPANRYVVEILDGYLTGDTGGDTIFTLYDGSGILLGTYNPQDSGGANYMGQSWYSLIQGATQLKVQIGSYATPNAAQNLQAVFDFSKIRVVQLINDLATISLAGSVENAAWLSFNNCTPCNYIDNESTMMDVAPAKFNGCSNSIIVDNRTNFSVAGMTGQNGFDNTILRNHADHRFYISGGTAMTGLKALRTHMWSSTNETGGVANYNTSKGTSWALEVFPPAGLPANVDFNDFEAEFVGISISGGQRVRCGKNRIKLGPMGSIGIEPASITGGTSNPSFFIDNDITWSSLNIPAGYAYAPSQSDGVVILGGVTVSPYLLFAASSTAGHTLTMRGVRAMAGACKVYAQFDNIILDDLTFEPCNQLWGNQGAGTQAMIALFNASGGNGIPRITNIKGHSTATYDISITNYKGHYITDLDIIEDYTKNYCMVTNLITGVAGNFTFERCKLQNVTAASLWHTFFGTPFSGTTTRSRGNEINGAAANADYTTNCGTLTGCQNIVADVNTAIGTVAAGGIVAFNLAVNAATPSAGDGVDISIPSGDLGCLISHNIAVANTVRVTIFNPSGSPAAFGTTPVLATLNKV